MAQLSMTRERGMAVAVALLLGLVPSAAMAQCHYDVTIIHAPECGVFGVPPISVLAINERGDIVGSYPDCSFGPDVPFIRTADGQFETLPLPADVSGARAIDINNHGDVLVTSQRRSFLWRDGAYVVELAPLGEGWQNRASSINDAAQISGSRSLQFDSYPQMAYRWQDGVFTDLGLMRHGSTTSAAMTEQGHVAGVAGPTFAGEGFVWSDRGTVLLGVVPGADNSQVNGVNGRGDVVGAVLLDAPAGENVKPIVWREGAWHDLAFLSQCTPGIGGAIDVNDAGQIVGDCKQSDSPFQPMLWHSGAVYDINDLVDLERGSSILRPRDISNRGLIAAQGSTSLGTAAFILTPADRPATDLNIDCRTDQGDLTILLEQWGTASEADFDGDGSVGFRDLLRLLADWG